MANKNKGASIMDMLSFVAVLVGGITLLVVRVLGFVGISASITTTLDAIANIIGWVILCLLSFNYIKTRKSTLMWVLWAVAVVMIVVSYILVIV